MFRFEYIIYLLGLWVIPCLVLLYLLFLKYNERQRNKLGNHDLLQRITQGEAINRKHIKFALLTGSFICMMLALANPQWGNKKEKVKATSSDIFIALDISQSMMAEDISPNRLERAKKLSTNLVQSLKGNRIGLIFFAGNAYLQMPLSSDYTAAQLFLSSANTGQAGTQGTAISEAISLALKTFEEDKPAQRGMILITDGESHDDEAIKAVAEAKQKGLNIFPIGVGTSQGGFIPIRQGNNLEYKKDQSGQIVTTQLNQELISSLAEAGGGRSYLIGEGNSIITDITREMERLEKQEVEQRAFTDYNSYFQYLIGLALVLLLIDFLIPQSQLKKA